MRLFNLVRGEDVTGVSGTGVIAEGVEFTDGTVVLRWRPISGASSVAVWPSVADMLVIHGHDGTTRPEFV